MAATAALLTTVWVDPGARAATRRMRWPVWPSWTSGRAILPDGAGSLRCRSCWPRTRPGGPLSSTFWTSAGGPLPVVLSVNARIADGLDTSWLWDVPFERLPGRPVVATGERRPTWPCASATPRFRHRGA